MEEIKQLVVFQEDSVRVAVNVVSVSLSLHYGENIMLVAPKKMLRNFLNTLECFMHDARYYNCANGYSALAADASSFASDIESLIVELENE